MAWRDEAEEVLAEMATIHREAKAKEDEAKAESKRVLDEAKKVVAPLREREEILSDKLETLCRAHRDEMEGKKSIDLRNGTVQFRNTPPSVIVEEGLEEEVVAEGLLAAGLSDFVRTKHLLNKATLRAALQDNELDGSLYGLGLSQEEDKFSVKFQG